MALGFCFSLAYLASVAGLAPIVGGFAAGLILDKVHYQDLLARDHARRDVPELLEPISTFLVPVFFVLMGMRVDLSVFGTPGVLGFAAVLTVAAVAGKQACGLAVLERGADRIAVGLGMIPRGEVGLIFASIGATLTIAGERVVAGPVMLDGSRDFSKLLAGQEISTIGSLSTRITRCTGARSRRRPRLPRAPGGRRAPRGWRGPVGPHGSESGPAWPAGRQFGHFSRVA